MFSNRGQMIKAFEIIFQKDAINWWVLTLILPTQLLGYFAKGNINYFYLQSKGEKVSRVRMTRIAAETNFVDHIVIFSGIAGIAFFIWRLSNSKIKASNSVCSQLISYLLIFISTFLLLTFSVVGLALNNGNTTVIISGLILVALALVILIIMFCIAKNHRRSERLAAWITRVANSILSTVTFGRKKDLVKVGPMQNFFDNIIDNLVEASTNKKALIKPFFWSLIVSALDASLVFITFAAMGVWINPFLVFVATGLSSNACTFAVTPGGVGVYETCMIFFLATAKLSAVSSIAGVLLVRSLLLVIYIAFGLPFLLMTIKKYGKPPTKTQEKN